METNILPQLNFGNRSTNTYEIIVRFNGSKKNINDGELDGIKKFFKESFEKINISWNLSRSLTLEPIGSFIIGHFLYESICCFLNERDWAIVKSDSASVISQWGNLLTPFLDELSSTFIVKDNGNLNGYLSGTGAYNEMGLTTQIPNEFTFATYGFHKPFEIGHIKVRFVKAYCNITAINIPLLKLLDAIKDIKSIPGTETNTALELIRIKLESLSLSQQNELGRLALNYPSSTRALTGAMLELLKRKQTSEKLFKSLNSLSRYKLGIKENILPNKNKWKIE